MQPEPNTIDLNWLRMISRRVTGRQIVLGLLLVALLVAVMSRVLPPATDWHLAFRPAVWALVAGRSPYSVEGYFNAPWALIPLAPLALLPESVGRAAGFLVALGAFTLVSRRLGASLKTTAVLLLSPPVWHGLLNGNIDWLAALGFIMPPQIGLFFVVIKPQLGIGVGLFWLVESWRQGGLKETLRVFGPIALVTLVSFALFGPWPLRFEREVALWWNASLWPMSIPVGLGLMVAAIRTRRIEYSIGASPCLSPYVLLHSWVGALLALSSSFFEMLAVVVGLWVVVLLRAIG